MMTFCVLVLGIMLGIHLKLGREQRTGVRKSGSLFSAPPASLRGDSWPRVNLLLKAALGPGPARGLSAAAVSIRSTQDCATIAREESGVLRPCHRKIGQYNVLLIHSDVLLEMN